MKIKSIKIAGFRGFNEEKIIDFNDKLTVISAPNSHGKTSISEAMEFLLYGSTSKVDSAYAKEEYKDSYRNKHFPESSPAYIEVEMVDSSNSIQVFRIEIDTDGSTRKYVDGQEVTEWPFNVQLDGIGRPFVLQHALKNLLLTAPVERFKGFAQLLGLNEVDYMLRAIVSLCTKPNASIPPRAVELAEGFTAMGTRLSLIPNFKKISTNFNKGDLDKAYAEIETYSDSILSSDPSLKGTKLEKLEKVRLDMAGKIYSGEIKVEKISLKESEQLDTYRSTLSFETEPDFIENYGKIAVAGVGDRLRKEAQLMKLGNELLDGSPDSCPLCLQQITSGISENIRSRHAEHLVTIEKETGRNNAKENILRILRKIKLDLSNNRNLITRPIQGLVTAMLPENKAKVIELVGGIKSETVKVIESSALIAASLKSRFEDSWVEVEDALNTCETGVKDDKIELSHAERLARVLNSHIEASNELAIEIPKLSDNMDQAAEIFRKSIDTLAGTSEISFIIEILKKQKEIEQGARIHATLAELKNLKKNSEQTLAEMMDKIMSHDLTDEVMKWYSLIKTKGDPEVHFSGFSMIKTASGDFKSGKLAVKAESYGVPLASAVSSLSESKLNALGLCVSIASATRKIGPWEFLIIDDPIQSWDDEHEIQFIKVIRNLIEEENKQVVVLTHKGGWAEQVCDGCRTINGNRYEIAGYAKLGPDIQSVDWASLENRINEVKTIANAPSASKVKIQQAEEEIRLISCQLAAEIARTKLSRVTSPHNMNVTAVRNILVSAGVPSDDTDFLCTFFNVSDDSHHAPKTYEANIQRVRQSLDTISKIQSWMKNPQTI